MAATILVVDDDDPRNSSLGLIRLNGALEYRAPLLRMIHRRDGAAEVFGAKYPVASGHANFPGVAARIFEQETRRPVRQVPHSSKRHFTHEDRPDDKAEPTGLYHRTGSLAASQAAIPPATSLTC